jgi:hypothetical protein
MLTATSAPCASRVDLSSTETLHGPGDGEVEGLRADLREVGDPKALYADLTQ